jgi:hypothetical protein
MYPPIWEHTLLRPTPLSPPLQEKIIPVLKSIMKHGPPEAGSHPATQKDWKPSRRGLESSQFQSQSMTVKDKA